MINELDIYYSNVGRGLKPISKTGSGLKPISTNKKVSGISKGASCKKYGRGFKILQ